MYGKEFDFLNLHNERRIREALARENIYFAVVQGEIVGIGSIRGTKNTYSVKKKNFEIAISRTDVTWELIDCKGSNIEEFFDVKWPS